ncbi:LAQU0S02e06744g1_1 [Lachancea quebecensis]|uniref:MICOS complex subunit MIC60 n=1 Tax=Lachancea quebecensis TaxID=1654605 RepID=A0A0P1KNV5_9SACH|nr:LAQU0S02e06744g1_1 [Lachancea quebecensis]
MLRSRATMNCTKIGRAGRAWKRGMATFEGQPAVRPNRLRKLLVRVGLATAGFYVGGVTLSLNNDQFGELFCDNVPLAESLVELYEEFRDEKLQASRMSLEELKQKFGELGTKVDRIPNRGADPAITSQAVAALPATKEVRLEEESLVKLRLPEVEQLDNCERATPLVESVNAAVAAVNEQSLLLPEDTYNAVHDAFTKLKAALQAINEDFRTNVAESVAVQYGQASKDLHESFELRAKSREVELTQQFLNEFNAFKTQLEKHSSEELASSLKANEQALLAKQSNEVALLSMKQVEEFTKILSEKLDQERQGRLSNLEALNGSVQELAEAVDQVDALVMKSEVLSQLSLLTTLLKNKLHAGDESSVKIDSELARIKTLCDIMPGRPSKCCSKNPQLLDVVVSQLDSLASQKLILSNEQLYNRWALLQKDLATSSLLPPNAGILGHISAKIFGFFLLNKNGAPVDNDIDSVIARVGQNLRLSKLDKAVEEVVALKGWPRVLCDEWVQEARKKLEIETLIDALDCEIRSL